MKVNELAERANTSPHVIRFYARTGLLRPRRNPVNGYRVFGDNEVTRVRCIRLAQCLGYTLAEIRDMLERIDQGIDPCDLMETVLRDRLRDYEQKIEALQNMQSTMQKALESLEKRAWNTASTQALCEHFQSLTRSA